MRPNDGWVYSSPRAEVIRDDHDYNGIRVTIPCTLASAKVSFHVDINFGDPIWPGDRLLDDARAPELDAYGA